MIRVTNRHHGVQPGVTVYVGRGTPLGNPFRTFKAGGMYSHDQAVKCYDLYLRQAIAGKRKPVCLELNRLYKLAVAGDLNLECSCAPQSCHADSIKAVLDEALAKR